MRKVTFAAALAACTAIAIASAKAAIVLVSGSIQIAVNQAKPGDIILVPPGMYRETVLVLKDDITIVGPKSAVIDARGFSNGIHVGADIFAQGPNVVPTCPAVAVKNFTLTGLTIQNAANNGIFLSGVDGYTLTKGTYLNNGDYAIYPSCSNNGQISFNHTKGGGDTCIYVGNDVGASIIGNSASECTVGVQIVNSDDVVVRANTVTDNSTGVLAIVDPDNPRTETSNVLIAANTIKRNNRPNTSTDLDLAILPSGVGVLVVGSDDVKIRKNEVTGNNTWGIAITDDPLFENPKTSNNDEVRLNVVLENGTDPSRPPGADLFYNSIGVGNCFVQNRFATSVPTNIEAQYPCH